MADLTDLKRGQIVAARRTGTRVTKIAELFDVARSTVLKVMTAFKKEGTHSLKQNSRRKRKLSVLERRTLTKIFKEWLQEYSTENSSRAYWPSGEPSFLQNRKKGAAQSKISRESCK